MTTKAKAMGGSLLIRNLRFTLPLMGRSLRPATASRFRPEVRCPVYTQTNLERQAWLSCEFAGAAAVREAFPGAWPNMQRALATRDVSSP
jgi:hypothetical protein